MTNSLDFRYNKSDVIKEISDYIDILKRKQMDYNVLLYGIKLPDYLSILLSNMTDRRELFKLLSDNNWKLTYIHTEDWKQIWTLEAVPHG